MRIAKRLLKGATLPILVPILASGIIISPLQASDVLQCVPYARDQSGIRIHGDAWTWWNQAKGNYQRGSTPKPGAVLSLANSEVMPLGHVAVVSRVVDDRRILLNHANWSAPGLIEQDVLAIDASTDNDWSQVRIWWGQGQQMGARLNPVNGFIYPRPLSVEAAPAQMHTIAARSRGPRLMIDPALFRATRDSEVSNGKGMRTLAMIVRDVKREARLP